MARDCLLEGGALCWRRNTSDVTVGVGNPPWGWDPLRDCGQPTSGQKRKKTKEHQRKTSNKD